MVLGEGTLPLPSLTTKPSNAEGEGGGGGGRGMRYLVLATKHSHCPASVTAMTKGLALEAGEPEAPKFGDPKPSPRPLGTLS